MPAVQAWTRPPGTDCSEGLGGCKALARSARKVFAQVGNAPFWVAARSAPRTLLEQFALDVFWFHVERLGWTPEAIARLGRAAGAEFWVQRRLASQPVAKRGVGWHFDKDENLLDDCGLFVQPFVATATYLTGKGAPLVVLTKPTLKAGPDGSPQADAPDLGAPRSASDAFVAFPSPGLHVAFRGSLLHGVPPFLEARKGERLSLLLNVCLRHRPLAMQRCHIGVVRRLGLTRTSGRGLRPGRPVRIRSRYHASAANVAASDAVSLTPDVGSWQLDGLRLPRDLSPDGVWRVQQTPGSLTISDPQTRGKGKRKRGQ